MVPGRANEGYGPAWQVQAALIARRFYLEGRSKVEISEELGLSRFKVARILDDARELGLVQVSVNLPAQIDAALSHLLRERFALRRALVVKTSDAGLSSPRPALGRVAADLLTELATAGDVLGFTCSRSVAATTEALTALPPCRVVQLSGTLAGDNQEIGSVESVRRAADVGGGRAHPIYAPMVLPDAATAVSLSRQPSIRQTLDRIEDVTLATVAVGAWQRELSTVWEEVEDDVRTRASEAGAVGEIAARLFDAKGRPLTAPVDDRVLALTLEQLKRIPEVIALAHDPRRGPAVRAALDAGLASTLVCNDSLARALLHDSDAGGAA
jgi:DNA-binding transcriptional regulator LsrR (DeoR family)